MNAGPIELFEYQGGLFPDYLKRGNACRFIIPTAQQFCSGRGLDVGASEWALPGAIPIDLKLGSRAEDLPGESWDYIFSSHCLEHVVNPVAVLEHWKSKLRPGGVLFLYLPHPEMFYWRPQNCRKHLHIWYPEEMVEIVASLGFCNIIFSQRDLYWSFCVVGVCP